MKEKSLLLQLTGETPLFKIIDFLIENKGMEFTKKDIIEKADISRASLFNYWNELEKHNLVKITRKFGKTKLFILNSENLIIKKILDLEKALIKEAMEHASKEKITIPVKAG